MNEHDALGLLREMAQRKVLVEICLTSNDVILGVRGADHPLLAYLRYGVPVALATDDEGVSRSDMTHEYLRAVQTYGLTYADLKRLARQSLEHSFLPGATLPAACTAATCAKLLDSSPRARVQWKLEQAFAEFERKF
jgi:adenosine deaminase